MTRLLEIAIEAARQLDPAEQDDLARTIMEIVNATDEGVYVLSDEERAAVERSREFALRGEFVPDEDFEAMLAKYR
jgi:hypothetical protein